MTVKEVMAMLASAPPDAQVCLKEKGSYEFQPIQGLKICRAYHTSLRSPRNGVPYLYSSVEFPSDYDKTAVVRIL